MSNKVFNGKQEEVIVGAIGMQGVKILNSVKAVSKDDNPTQDRDNGGGIVKGRYNGECFIPENAINSIR